MRADTVIVGAGSAGAVIAARMTERGEHDVLLLEAGPDYPDPAQVPRDLADGTRNSMHAHDWGFHHLPTPGKATFVFPRGRVVGGSSAVNTCIALRGQPYDYDEWAARGLPDWSFDACLPAFKRLEHDLDFGGPWHGQDGPIPIRRHRPEELSPWQVAFLQACTELGFPACADHNDPTTTGHGPHAMNKIDGRRMSVARGYLTPETRRRSNLRIVSGALVRRVLFSGRRAVGVEIEHEHRVVRVDAKRVVLSGGAIATPGILLRSGVGPRAELERLGVELVADVPAVGARLLDHPGVAIFLVPKKGLVRLTDPLIQTTMRYRSAHSTVPNDMQLQPGSFVPLGFADIPGVSMMTSVGKPRGFGSMRFPSADPRAKPLIDSRFLLDPDDLDKAMEAMELAAHVVTSSAMRDLATCALPTERGLMSRRAIRSWIHAQCGSGYHPCGTVPMGADDDPDAATDGRGRVRGVEGLVVADASLMPTVPSSNTNLPTIMIGERFGEWLREGAV